MEVRVKSAAALECDTAQIPFCAIFAQCFAEFCIASNESQLTDQNERLVIPLSPS